MIQSDIVNSSGHVIWRKCLCVRSEFMKTRTMPSEPTLTEEAVGQGKGLLLT